MCSLTCYSWYIAAVPHLHHTITFGDNRSGFAHGKLKQLSKLHELGLIPLVAEVRVFQSNDACPWFAPRAFSPRDLRYFSTFANVQKLKLDRVDISNFIPEVERYFGQFSATLQSIALIAPRCTPRQLSHFLSHFPNLDNLEIRVYFPPSPLSLPAIPDTELVPITTSKLRGQLVLASFREVKVWKDLITSCGGLQFHTTVLRNVANCAPVILEACSETLETLRFFPTDGFSE